MTRIFRQMMLLTRHGRRLNLCWLINLQMSRFLLQFFLLEIVDSHNVHARLGLAGFGIHNSGWLQIYNKQQQ